MHTVRVYRNDQGGTRWWAEDDRGFVGGADDLDELLDHVREWVRCEGLRDYEIEHVSDVAEPPPAVRTGAVGS